MGKLLLTIATGVALCTMASMLFGPQRNPFEEEEMNFTDMGEDQLAAYEENAARMDAFQQKMLGEGVIVEGIVDDARLTDMMHLFPIPGNQE